MIAPIPDDGLPGDINGFTEQQRRDEALTWDNIESHPASTRQVEPFAEVPSGIALARYFWEETEHRNPDYSGIKLYREGPNYCYVWVEAVVDLDMLHTYLLDVRTSIGNPGPDRFNETRDYLFVCVGAGGVFEVEWHQKPIRFDAPAEKHHDRLYTGLHWFANQTVAAAEER